MRIAHWNVCKPKKSKVDIYSTAKHVYSSSDVFEHSDYYVYDASGNLMSVYRKFSDANEQVLSYSLTERPMYGSSRLGVDKTTIEFIGYTPPTNGLTNHVLGLKQYEGSNHLGNVLTTFSDKKMPVDANSDGIIDYSTADITSSTDYYPFGVTMKARDFTSNVSRFGFNGKEKDDETETMDFGARLLDGDLGVWLALDPLMNSFPGVNPYNFCYNNPIVFIDFYGEKGVIYIQIINDKDGKPVISKKTADLVAKVIREKMNQLNVDVEVRIVFSNSLMTRKQFNEKVGGTDIAYSYIIFGNSRELDKLYDVAPTKGWQQFSSIPSAVRGTSTDKLHVVTVDNVFDEDRNDGTLWNSYSDAEKLAWCALHEDGHVKFDDVSGRVTDGPNYLPITDKQSAHIPGTIMNEKSSNPTFDYTSEMRDKLQKIHGRKRDVTTPASSNPPSSKQVISPQK